MSQRWPSIHLPSHKHVESRDAVVTHKSSENLTKGHDQFSPAN